MSKALICNMVIKGTEQWQSPSETVNAYLCNYDLLENFDQYWYFRLNDVSMCEAANYLRTSISMNDFKGSMVYGIISAVCMAGGNLCCLDLSDSPYSTTLNVFRYCAGKLGESFERNLYDILCGISGADEYVLLCSELPKDQNIQTLERRLSKSNLQNPSVFV